MKKLNLKFKTTFFDLTCLLLLLDIYYNFIIPEQRTYEQLFVFGFQIKICFQRSSAYTSHSTHTHTHMHTFMNELHACSYAFDSLLYVSGFRLDDSKKISNKETRKVKH